VLLQLVSADLVVDINGWYAWSDAFTSVSPRRVFDTRADESPHASVAVPKQQLAGDPALQVRMTPPGTGVAAVSLNVAVTNRGRAGSSRVYPCGARKPRGERDLRRRPDGRQRGHRTGVSASGDVCFYSSVPVDLVVDINGWFSAGPAFTRGRPRAGVRHPPGRERVRLRTVPSFQVDPTHALEVRVTDLGIVRSTASPRCRSTSPSPTRRAPASSRCTRAASASSSRA
jgi:hypothetical protein